jgi:hypothetical protein
MVHRCLTGRTATAWSSTIFIRHGIKISERKVKSNKWADPYCLFANYFACPRDCSFRASAVIGFTCPVSGWLKKPIFIRVSSHALRRQIQGSSCLRFLVSLAAILVLTAASASPHAVLGQRGRDQMSRAAVRPGPGWVEAPMCQTDRLLPWGAAARDQPPPLHKQCRCWPSHRKGESAGFQRAASRASRAAPRAPPPPHSQALRVRNLSEAGVFGRE